MRLLFILLLIPVLLLGQKILSQPHAIPPHAKQYKEITLTPTPSHSVTPTVSLAPTSIPSHTITATPTPANATSSIPNDFIYPEAHQTNQTNGTITLESSDDAGTVTNWYKEKIKNLGWNTTSVIENTVNGNVSNQLVAGNGSKEVRINLIKQNGESTVHISVSE